MYNNEFTQEKLKELFLQPMSDEEKAKLDQLGMNDEISKLETPRLEVKYFNNIGYTFISDGYLIMNDGLEVQHYFCTVIKDANEARKYINSKINSRKSLFEKLCTVLKGK